MTSGRQTRITDPCIAWVALPFNQSYFLKRQERSCHCRRRDADELGQIRASQPRLMRMSQMMKDRKIAKAQAMKSGQLPVNAA